MKLAVSLYSLEQSIEELLKKGLSSIFGNLLAIFQFSAVVSISLPNINVIPAYLQSTPRG